MSEAVFRGLLVLAAVFFTVFFSAVVVPPLLENPDIIGAFAAGFVNPFSTGYSTDVLVCWAVLAVWVVFEARQYGVRHGWVCLLVGVVPGVAVGFAGYLLLRTRQLTQHAKVEQR